MKPKIVVSILTLVFLSPVSGAEEEVLKPASVPVMTAAECEVWNRERSFSQSVERHDAVAFADHVQVQTVFQAGSGSPVRGRDAVVADWKSIIEGKEIVLRWYPGFVSIGGDPRIAMSAGPAWIENPSPGADPRYRVGSYVTTWVREDDGEWRVMFDRSGEPMRPSTADEVAKLIAARPAECPHL